MENSFDKISMKNLQLLNSVLSPSHVPNNMNGLEEHGEAELKQLVEIYGSDNGLTDSERTLEDYFQLRVVLKSLNSSLTEACSSILNEYKDIFPDFAFLATIVLISPVTLLPVNKGSVSTTRSRSKDMLNSSMILLPS